MRPRQGVSLVEVLVATVLLAVGVSATLHALAAAAGLRRAASAREALAAVALDRLAWFEARACGLRDTSGLDTTAELVLHWFVADSLARRTLRVHGHTLGGRGSRLRFDASWPCV